MSSSPMRILAIGDGPIEEFAGLSRYLTGLAGAMLARGHTVVPVVAPSSGSLLTRVLHVARAVHRQVRHMAIDVIDVHFALYAWLPLRLRSVRSVPLVVHFQGPWADEAALVGASRPKRMVQRAIERSVYHRAQSIVVLSEAFRDLIIERYRVDPDRVIVIPPGIDLDRFAPGARDEARQRLGAAPGSFVAVSVRRLERRMGLDVLLRAWDELATDHPDAVLMVAGDGSWAAELGRVHQSLRSPDRVRLLGRVSDGRLLDLYRAADVSVVASTALEGFGLVVLESLACGTPVVVTDMGGLPEAVRGLDGSAIVPVGDAIGLAQALRSIRGGDADIHERSRRRAECFAWPRIAEEHDRWYRAAARPRAPFTEQPARSAVGAAVTGGVVGSEHGA